MKLILPDSKISTLKFLLLETIECALLIIYTSFFRMICILLDTICILNLGNTAVLWKLVWKHDLKNFQWNKLTNTGAPGLYPGAFENFIRLINLLIPNPNLALRLQPYLCVSNPTICVSNPTIASPTLLSASPTLPLRLQPYHCVSNPTIASPTAASPNLALRLQNFFRHLTRANHVKFRTWTT